MKKNYTFLAIPNYIYSISRVILSKYTVLFLVLSFLTTPIIAQKGKGGGGNKDVILFTCAEDIGNGLYLANFGYTNPTNKTITVGQEESYIFLSDRIEDSEFNGIQKIDGITSFEPGTHEKVLSVVLITAMPNGPWHSVAQATLK
ncbi:hypothetical protein [uncultured Eudoraea sp.]|uniref:hypothetical protein n=1 Tax=uncultured Eudoraea sp. TaxID=1035614 RepID=UPI0026384A6B|nr:hypothetical protein [uncultured Eudoraea sp.]